MAINKANTFITSVAAGLAALGSVFAAAAPATAQESVQDVTVTHINSIENVDQQYLLEQSANQLVLHYHPDTLGIQTGIEDFIQNNYNVLGIPDIAHESGTVDAYIKGKGPRTYNQDQILGGQFAFELEQFYNNIFGQPEFDTASLN